MEYKCLSDGGDVTRDYFPHMPTCIPVICIIVYNPFAFKMQVAAFDLYA